MHADAESQLVEPVEEPFIECADNGVLHWPQCLADRQQHALARLAGHKDELSVAFDQPAKRSGRGSHEFKHTRASKQLVRYRIAMSHPPGRVGVVLQNSSFRVGAYG